jgi:gliding motility-associated protein GldM
MYLVLLALLALQVSSAILQKFQFLNASLENTLAETIKNNSEKEKLIRKAVEDNRNKASDVELLKAAEEVRAKCKAVIDELAGLKTEIIEKTGGIEENGSYKGAKDEDVLANMMVGDGIKAIGKAHALKDRLNGLVSDLNGIIDRAKLTEQPKFNPIALDGKDDPVFQKDPDQKNKNFAELNFQSTPMIAGLAVLTEKQSRVAAMEAEMLGVIKEKLGGDVVLKADKVVGMYRANSSVVAAGTDYEAEMFVAAYASNLIPTMTFRGAPIKVENGVGKIKFRASATTYDKEGNSKQNWEGKIAVPIPGKGDTIIPVKGEYIVAKPVIDVKSASVSALYYNCGNDLNIQVPALGANYKPSFSASGANVITGAEKGMIIVVPTTKDKVSINVSSEGAAIGKVEFPVRAVPRPSLVAKIAGQPVDQKRGVQQVPQSIMVVAEPDPAFAAALPKEARYGVTDGEITLARGKREVKTMPFNSGNVNLGPIRGEAQSGDRIIIQVKKVLRKNFKEATEDVPVPQSSSIITIPVQ